MFKFVDVLDELGEADVGVGVGVFADAVIGEDDGFAFIFGQFCGVCAVMQRDHA